MKKKTLRIILLGLVLATLPLFSVSSEETKHNYVPKEGYVPNADTAIKIAEAVWLPIYGKGINDMKPFKATLKGGVWTVEGTLPKVMPGGVPVAEVDKNTGQIIRVSHGQ